VRLAICHPNVIPARGGCETYAADLTRRLIAAGHQVDLYASRWDEAALPREVQYHHVAEAGWPRFLRPWRWSAACREARRGLPYDLSLGFDKVLDVDVLYPLGGLHVAAVEHTRGKFRSPFQRGLAQAVRALDPSHRSFCWFERRQYLSPSAPFVIANSELVRQHLRQYLDFPSDRVAVLHCAIDPSRFVTSDQPTRRAAMRKCWGAASDEVIALFVAMNYRLKGLDPLLRAVALLPTGAAFRLVVVGNPSTARYRQLARQLRIESRVHFHGFAKDPRDLFFGADFLVHPTFYDPCSLVVLEARACGLPVITTAFNGAAELLDPPHDGLVVRTPHDTEALAGGLRYFLDPIQRRAASTTARQRAQLWTWETHFQRLLALLHNAAARKQAA
jgi:UDP-glucose:(heptosyl)LPS alpha-1,3-glucosyltransferase